MIGSSFGISIGSICRKDGIARSPRFSFQYRRIPCSRAFFTPAPFRIIPTVPGCISLIIYTSSLRAKYNAR
jgi:hypothetical protein